MTLVHQTPVSIPTINRGFLNAGFFRMSITTLSLLLISNFVRAENPELIPWKEATPLAVETVGPSVGRIWLQQLKSVPLPNEAGYKQLFSRKDTERGLLTLLTLDLQTGAMKTHPPVQAYEIWSQMQVGSLLYLGVNLPDLLMRYDPVRDEFEQLGSAFNSAQGIYTMNLDPNGIILMGSTPTGEVSEFNPTTGQFIKYGVPLASNGGYVYSLNGDATSITAAVRGHQWDVVSINRATKQITTLMSLPADGWIEIVGRRNIDDNVTFRVSRPGATAVEVYKVINGEMFLNDKPFPSVVAAPTPTVVLDTNSAYFLGSAPVYYQRLGETSWNQTSIETRVEPRGLHHLAQNADGTIVGTPTSYGSVLAWNSKTEQGRVLGMYMNSINAITGLDGTIYTGSYPSAALSRIDPQKNFTIPYEVPGQPAIPVTSASANPWMIKYLSADLDGAHDVGRLVAAPDGSLYIGALRFRYYDGFRLGRYDPATNVHTKIDDEKLFDHFGFSWMTLIQQGQKLAITTWIDYDNTIGGPQPESAKIIMYDIKQRKFSERIPLPGFKRLIHVVEIGDGVIVGTGVEGPIVNHAVGTEVTTLFRYDLKTGTLLHTRRYGGIVGALSGGTTLFPRHGHGFEIGPDGWIWTAWQLPYASSPSLVLRINPATLEVIPLGTLTGGLRFLFDRLHPGDLFVTGASQLRRLRGIVPIQNQPPPQDTQAPSVPGNVTASAVSSSQINLTWSASSDNVGVMGYKVFRNGQNAAIATLGNVTSFSNTGLVAGVSYSYQVSAIDAAGNESAKSAPVGAQTLSDIENENPNASSSVVGFLPFKNIFNPAKGETLRIRFSLESEAPSDFSIDIRDRLGNNLADLTGQVNNTGNGYELVWDGLNSSQSLVASGTYVVVLKQSGKVITTKVIVIK
jgi:hypothetical protein